MEWRSIITRIYDTGPPRCGIARKPEFYSPALKSSIADAELALNTSLPDSLHSLLLDSNGVMEMLAIEDIDEGAWFESGWLLWSIEEIVKENQCFRSSGSESAHRRNFNSLLFFANAGTDGILFAFPVENGVCSDRVVVWHPIMDELDEVALNLVEFLQGWLTGLITV